MKTTVILLLATFLLCPALYGETTEKHVHHGLEVSLQPKTQSIKVTDTIKIPSPPEGKKLHFLLHGNLNIESNSPNVKLTKEAKTGIKEFFSGNTALLGQQQDIPVRHYALDILEKPAGNDPLTLSLTYSGIIHHPVKQEGGEYARGFSQTPGIISEKGVYLAGASFWVPRFDDGLVAFHMKTVSPAPYITVSQGKRQWHDKKNNQYITTWDSPEPMDEIYLIAAPFHEYLLEVRKVNVMAFLRSKDDALADKYLQTTGQYLEMYHSLIGPYPYSKFALVENFWETGYGMPSFTLLGPQVIRFPFILHSSYPHELLHNYWGNSVFVDFQAGNWSEGLTVYHADHLIAAQRGRGAEYRKRMLQEYTHYAVGKKEEFPLTQFRSRYDALSSAIGYGKSMMVFHMLRLRLGDDAFNKTFQRFYKNNTSRRATFDDIRTSAEAVAGKDLETFFQQWTTRTGAPELKLSGVTQKKTGDRYHVSFSLEQAQPGEPYHLNVPASVYLRGQKTVTTRMLDLTGRTGSYSLSFPQEPLALQIDPGFDLFRRLHPNEIPPALSRVYGAPKILMLLPSIAPAPMLEAYRKLAQKWAGDSKGKISVKLDKEVSTLPPDQGVWLLGRENLHVKIIKKGLSPYDAAWEGETLRIGKTSLPFGQRSIIAAVTHPGNTTQAVVLLSADRPAALAGLSRKLPHYGKYSYLAFEGDGPANTFKGQWPVVNSPLFAVMNPEFNGLSAKEKPQPAAEKPLARLAPLFSAKRMMKHVTYLASEELEGRGLGYKGLEKAAHYIATAFKKTGLKPGGANGSYMQDWQAEVGKNKQKALLRNVIGVLPGADPAYKDQCAVICAHYDHLGHGWPDVHEGDEGKIHLGADDNASGVAVMLELAQVLGKSFKPQRTVVFIAFTGEENGLMGSKHYVKQLQMKNKKQLEGIMGVINLDTVGRLPEKGKLMVLGGNSAREWRFIFMGIGYTTGIETQLVTQDLDAGDQVPFIQAGVPGIQLFSGPHADYHRPSDTVDKIAPKGLVKVAAVAKEALVYLSERKEPMTFQGKQAKPSTGKPKASAPPGAQPQSGRKVRTGMMPDFAFSGKGVKVGAVSPGSPMAKAGLKKGDIIIKVGTKDVANLREYAGALKAYKPGDTVTLVYLRDGASHSKDLVLEAR